MVKPVKKFKNERDKEQYKELLSSLCEDVCDKPDCFLKDVLVDVHPSPRLLVQLKCIHKFKNSIEKSKGKAISASEAVKEWIEKGYAKKFADNYNESKTYIQIYKATVG